MQRDKDKVAELMRQKQAAGKSPPQDAIPPSLVAEPEN